MIGPNVVKRWSCFCASLTMTLTILFLQQSVLSILVSFLSFTKWTFELQELFFCTITDVYPHHFWCQKDLKMSVNVISYWKWECTVDGAPSQTPTLKFLTHRHPPSPTPGAWPQQQNENSVQYAYSNRGYSWRREYAPKGEHKRGSIFSYQSSLSGQHTQIRARGVRNFFLLKRCNLGHSECFKICYYQPKNQQF